MTHPIDPPRALLEPQLRALAAAAGLVGRPRLRAGLALTLAFACGPAPDDVGPGASGDTTLADASSTLAPTTGMSGMNGMNGENGETGVDEVTTSGASDGASTTLLTSSTTLAGSSDDSGTTTLTTSGTDTGDASGSSGDTGELDDCVLDRTTMEMDWACCEAQNWMPAPQCTPWGPPAPPSAALLQRARLARRVLA